MPEDAPKSRYHHGDLRQALIDAAESILLERGVDGFSLREAARRAGVSPAAPAHHFGDARGLLTAIATLGFDGLADALAEANRATEGQGRRARIHAQGHAYVGFALGRPARFDLMWQRDRLDMDDPAHRAASARAYGLLHEAVTGEPLDAECIARGLEPDSRVVACWSIVHGYVGLARRGSIDPTTPGLLDGVLACLNA